MAKLGVFELSKETIDEIFANAKEQGEYIIALYRVAFPCFDEIKHINGYPVASEKTNDYIFRKAVAYDKEHHPEVISGGAWLNHGFAYDKNIGEWAVDTTSLEGKIEWEEFEDGTNL